MADHRSGPASEARIQSEAGSAGVSYGVQPQPISLPVPTSQCPLPTRSGHLLIEGIANGLYKAEVIHRRSWQSLEAVELATLEWVNWFNLRRLLEPISNIPPAEAEAAYYQQTRELAMAA